MALVVAAYDGSSGTLVDTNVWLDCIKPDSLWKDWAINGLQSCGERAPLHLNIIVYTELLALQPEVAAIDALLDIYGTHRSQLPWSCAGLTARAFSIYRSRGGARTRPMPDFYIGAHASVANLSVLTRDPAGYRSYYPKLRLISP